MAPSGPLVWRVAELDGVPAADSLGDEVFFPTRARYIEVATALCRAGFVTCSDLCAVDYLTHPDRALPEAVRPERFEVVVNLLSHAEVRRARLRVMVPEDDPVCPTLFSVYPGTENMEREAYDLMGIRFVGHPDPSRILLPQDWEGHPLRRDYGTGRVPVQFKEAPGPR
ncbi:MAG: NADH-quinone oxidoreductase subunit C [Acidimicrobiales bacterium]|jgi:NADH-quinone oxidoreductase subunit C